jgi:hypothetical protein
MQVVCDRSFRVQDVRLLLRQFDGKNKFRTVLGQMEAMIGSGKYAPLQGLKWGPLSWNCS